MASLPSVVSVVPLRLVSSANFLGVDLIPLSMSLIKILNSSSQRTDSWGTPLVTTIVLLKCDYCFFEAARITCINNPKYSFLLLLLCDMKFHVIVKYLTFQIHFTNNEKYLVLMYILFLIIYNWTRMIVNKFLTK